MYLSKIEIFGFKSFAEKTKIEFGDKISAIVGPNGTGKSNIVDAIRWVLGEQGDRVLRSERREDVVFSGTKNRKPLGVAEVSLTIENNKNILPTEYREVEIARRFYRSGDTEYFLNGTKVRLKDIRNLFIDTGIGPDAYSVIELKMVETILSHVKNERRKLFEEAAGVVSYKHNRDLTYKRLDSVKDSLSRVNDIIREKQRNVNALERQAKKNQEAKKVSEELKKLELVISNIDYKNLLDEIKNIKDHEHENISLKEKLHNEINEFDEKSDLLREEIQKYEFIINELNERLTEKKDKINEYERDTLVANEKIKSTEQNILRLENENKDFKESIRINKDKESELNDKINVLTDTLSVSEDSLTDKKKNVDDTIKTINEKKNEIIELGNRLKSTNKILNESKGKYQENKINLENNLSQLEKITENTSQNLNTLNINEGEKNKLEKELHEINNKLKSAESELNYYKNLYDDLFENITESDKDITQRTIELQEKKSKVSHLNNLLTTFEDYAEGVKYLLKDNQQSSVQTVIDSIEVDDKYKVAIETALGEVSNYLILDNSRELDKLINLLSKNEKGKVTFILNEKLSYGNLFINEFLDHEPEFIREKGVHGFADKFVKCSEQEYFLLIKYLLDEYIIVDDLNTAYRLSKDNFFKFITLDGDIVTESFIRAGSKVKEESIKLGRQKQIDRLIIENEKLETVLNEKRNEVSELKRKFDEIDIDHYKNTFDQIEREYNRVSNEISKIDFKLEEINKTIDSNDDSYNSIQSENKILNDTINRLIDEVNKYEHEHSNLDGELGFLTDEFNEIEQKYSEYLSEYNSFNLEMTKLKSEFKNEEQNLDRIKKSIEYQSSQIEKNTNEIERENNSFEELKVKVKDNNGKLIILKEEEGEILEEYNSQKDIFDEKKKVQNEIDLDQRDRRARFDDISQKLIDSQIKIKENEIKSEQLKDYIFKKYEIEIPLKDEFREEIEKEFVTEENKELDIVRAKKRIEGLSERLKKLGGGYQQVIWEDFEYEKEELSKMIVQRKDLHESEKDIRKTIERINTEARERFFKTFDEIRQNFSMIFKQLFQEGDEANLRLVYDVDEEGKLIEDPLESKIEITAKPRGKRPTSIELLSGGEKTLTAIALLFAIYLVKPSPFCVLDEVDAPLDVANLARFNKMIRRFSENTQFILITHNERTMETVDKLYGVTMQEPGVTTIVETTFKEKAS